MRASGALLPEEIEFIESGGGQLLFIPMGEHGQIFEDEYQEQVAAFIRGDQLISSTVPAPLSTRARIYPTVATDWALLEADQVCTALIFDSTGRLVYEAVHVNRQTRIDVSRFNSGYYYVVLHSAVASQTISRFIVR
ncbi:MAG: T9SS type A sorting domain-containing protein [Bacteroidota bacterium]